MAERIERFEGTGRFPTTSWNLIVHAQNPYDQVSRDALGRLCGSYWYPIFAFIRRKGLDPDRARDCTQDFFTALLEKEYLSEVVRSKGLFRSFLMASATHFLSNWFDAERAQKRGGGRRFLSLELENAEGAYRSEPAESLTPEALFEYQWAKNLMQRTLQRLRSGYAEHDFDVLKPFLLGDAARGDGVAASEQLGMSEGAFKTAIHRLRKHYRDLVRAEIAETVADASQVDDEIRYLLTVFARGEKAL